MQQQRVDCESKTRGRRPAEYPKDTTFSTSFIYGGHTIDDLLNFFVKRKTWFVTINPYKKDKRYSKYQSISKISDILRRYCASYFIVLEHNKDGSSHYHAICGGYNERKNLPKGLKWHVQPIGVNPVGPCPYRIPEGPPITEESRRLGFRHLIAEELGVHHHLLGPTQELLCHIRACQRKCRARLARMRCKLNKKGHVGRVLSYMIKTHTGNFFEYKEYRDYALGGREMKWG